MSICNTHTELNNIIVLSNGIPTAENGWIPGEAKCHQVHEMGQLNYERMPRKTHKKHYLRNNK